MAHIGILQHFWCETAGVFEDCLREDGHTTTSVALFKGETVPAAGDFDAWIVMGGPMNVDDIEHHPYLRPERELLAGLIATDRPVLGICLGAQLIARAAGACVYPGPVKEIGLFDVDLTPAAKTDPLFSLFQPETPVFQWHGDTFDLPDDAVSLACSPHYPNQAFRLGRRVYAIQFHIECTPAIARQWCEAWLQEFLALPAAQRFDPLSPEFAIALHRQNSLARAMARQWISLTHPGESS